MASGAQQRIVFADDAHALLSGLAWLHTHGKRDDRVWTDRRPYLAFEGPAIWTSGEKLKPSADQRLLSN